MAKRRARNRERRSRIGGGAMSQLSLAMRIGAVDDTRSGMSSVLSQARSMAAILSKPIVAPFKLGLNAAAMLRDFNLGLMPVMRAAATGIDTIASRGGRIAQISEQFQKVTGLSARMAESLAGSLQNAADGELRRGDAMAQANQLMAAGVTSMKDISTIYEFAARRADAFGESGKGAIEGIVGSMRRGSFRALKEFGIDIGDVADQFEQMQAGGKFTSMEFAARKAAVLRTTIDKMREGIDSFGTGFQHTLDYWDMAKSRAGDMVDSLLLGIERSETMREAVKGLSEGLGGISEHFRAGGSIADILVGKQGGKSGGLFGLMKAGVTDVGSYFGRSIAAGGLRGMAAMLEEMPALGDTLWAGGTDFVKQLRKTFDNAIDRLQKFFPTWMQKNLPATMGQIDKANDASAAGDWLRYMTHTTAAAGKFGAESLFKLGHPRAGALVDTATNMIPLGGLFSDGGPLGWIGKIIDSANGNTRRALPPALDWKLQILGPVGAALIEQTSPMFPDTGPVSRSANRHGLPEQIAKMRAKADALQRGGIFAPNGSEFMKEWGLFQGDLPAALSQHMEGAFQNAPPDGLELNIFGRRRRKRDLVSIEREERQAKISANREARKNANAWRREQSYDYRVTRDDVRNKEAEEFNRIFGPGWHDRQKRRAALRDELNYKRPKFKPNTDPRQYDDGVGGNLRFDMGGYGPNSWKPTKEDLDHYERIRRGIREPEKRESAKHDAESKSVASSRTNLLLESVLKVLEKNQMSTEVLAAALVGAARGIEQT
jgi:hypothetical protein